MFRAALLLTLILAQNQKFQVDGQIVSAARQQFRWIQIESVDRRFVDTGEIDPDGMFVLKNIPEGLYKLIIVASDRKREEQRTIEVRPAFADAHGRIAVKIELPDTAAAADKFKVGVNALGVSPKAVEELHRAYEARGDIEKARQHLQKAIDIAPNFDEALNNLGTIYYHDQNFTKAAELFARALQANPNSFPAQVNLGGALISSRDYERALTENLKAVDMRPGDSLAQSQLGQSFFYLKRYDEALIHLKAAKNIDPMSFTLPGFFIAEIYHARGEKESAVEEYQEFLKVHPGHPYTTLIQNRIRAVFTEKRQSK
jgi:tetratricopeptide (TPR) repeat protein